MHGSLPGLAAGRFGVIMFFSACRLPSFAPEDPPSHASKNQITTGSAVAKSRASARARESSLVRLWRQWSLHNNHKLQQEACNAARRIHEMHP